LVDTGPVDDPRCFVPPGAQVSAALPRDGLRCTRYPFALSAPRDVVETSSGIYVTEMGAGRVVRLTDSGFVVVASGLSAPIGIREKDGKLIVSEENAHRISRIDPVSGARETIAEALGNVTYLELGPDGIYVSSFTALDSPTAVIKRVSDTVTDAFTGLNVPEGLAFDGTTLMVVEWGKPSRVSRFPGGVYATGFDRAYGIAKSPNGWFVSDTAKATVIDARSDGTQEIVLNGAAVPAGMFRAKNGDLLVVEHGNQQHTGTGYLLRLTGF
jgi:hypothetical protein